MKSPIHMQPSPASATPQREELAPLRVLVVAAEGGGAAGPGGAGLLQGLRQLAADGRIEIDSAPDLPRAVRQLAGGRWDLIVAMLGEHPDDDLAWWVDSLRGVAGSPRLIAAVQTPSMGLVLRAEKAGVLDVLSLPLRRDDLVRALERLRSATTEVAVSLPPTQPHAVGPYALVGQSPAMLEVYKLLARVAGSTATVLVQGESGTGKEVVARAVHLNGPSASGPFVAVNCAAIPENLLESELFGHEKGAFTGAIMRKIGRFEQAAGGTLFLDEVADMSLALQAKILRAVQEREIERVGGGDTIPVDVRLIAATNRDLKEAIKQGRFREDLYYRLAVVTVRLPRLAERGDDLVLLTAYFVRHFAERYGKRIEAISDRALELLRGHPWVGNVRELRNVIERAVIVAADDTLRAEHLPEELRGEEVVLPDRPQGGLLTLAELEARHIARVLAHTHGQIGAAAEILGIHRNTLTRKMKEYGL
jgi:two-component system, NtrC family, response regulator AtoC